MIQLKLHQRREILFQGAEGITHIKTLPYFSLVQAVSGRYELGLNGAAAQSTRLFLAPPQALQTITHRMDPKTGTMAARWVFFDLEIDDKSAELRYDFHPFPAVEALMEEFFRAEDECDQMSIGYRIVKELLRTATPRDGREQELMPVIDHLKTHYTRPVTVAELAGIVHWSESKLYARFSETFGRSPIAWLNDYRLSMATKLLKSTTEPIESVARAVGIEDPRYFSKRFRQRYQCTPGQYRKNTLL